MYGVINTYKTQDLLQKGDNWHFLCSSGAGENFLKMQYCIQAYCLFVYITSTSRRIYLSLTPQYRAILLVILIIFITNNMIWPLRIFPLFFAEVFSLVVKYLPKDLSRFFVYVDIKIDVRYFSWYDLMWIQLLQDSIQWRNLITT